MTPLWRVLAFLALALRPAAAADAPVRLYEPASIHWTLSVQTPLLGLAGSGTPLAAVAAMAQDQRAAALAPVVFELQHSLHLSAQEFAALEPAAQSAALSLAADEARENIVQRSYELVGESKALVWSQDAVDRDQLTKLHALASRLQEINRHYGFFLGPDEREAVAMTSAQAANRYIEARAAYLGQAGKATAEALGQGGQRAPPEVGVEAGTPGPAPLVPTTRARKLLERMKETKSGWGEKDLEAVYVGYGFVYRDGAKHRIYSHPIFKQLRTTVSRQTSLPPGYAVDAVKLITEAEALSAPAAIPALAAGGDMAELPPVPPAPVKISPIKTVPKPVARVETTVMALAPLTPSSGVAVEKKIVEKPAPARPETTVVAQPAIEPPPAPTGLWNGFRARLKRLFGS